MKASWETDGRDPGREPDEVSIGAEASATRREYPKMKWSLKLGTFAGIGVYLHWTFALLIGWVFLMYYNMGGTVQDALVGVAFVLALFVCVVLHEFGHALTARRYGVQTRDITLLPIGGIARLERIPEKPMQEFWVAVAGPAVNVAIAAVLFMVLLLLDRANQIFDLDWSQSQFLTQLMWVNLFIVVFNMIPAFPMDGGRVLRSLLATRMGRVRATNIAANLGQMIAILFGVAGLFVLMNPFLILIAVVVYLGAQGEAVHVELQSALEGLSVRDAMITRFRSLPPQAPLSQAVEELLAGSQHDFPVIQDSQLLGVLRRDDLIKALADRQHESLVGDVMSRDCSPVNATDVLTRTLETMTSRRGATLPVMDSGRLVGLLTMENVGELIMINKSLGGEKGGRLMRHF